MTNFTKISFDLTAGRTEFHNALKLTGCEVSFNNFPADAAVPFVHSHKQNEEFYVVLKGDGEIYIDGEIVKLSAGDAFKVAPQGKRCLKAGPTGMSVICVQSKEQSLDAFTADDANILQDVKSPWQK
ncbi:MAG: cupin domain-containing protein [Succinivibrio sp.]|nr:cupin domain-containing protein [Succinivibrio sp.]